MTSQYPTNRHDERIALYSLIGLGVIGGTTITIAALYRHAEPRALLRALPAIIEGMRVRDSW